jgi:hypothetical protein
MSVTLMLLLIGFGAGMPAGIWLGRRWPRGRRL